MQLNQKENDTSLNNFPLITLEWRNRSFRYKRAFRF